MALEDLRQAREQEGDNPFSYLRSIAGMPSSAPQEVPGPAPVGEDEEEDENPFSYLASLDPGRPMAEAVDSAGGRFVRGVGRGVIHPVRAFLPQREEASLGVAGAMGEFIGAGLTFIPLFKGASTVLSGVGLLRPVVTATGQTVRTLGGSVNTANLATGGLAGAGFEAFAGETIEEAPVRALRGVAEGLAFEAGLLGVARLWRGKRAPAVEAPRPANAPPSKESEVFVDPLRLKLEQGMRPLESDTPDMVRTKLREIQGSEGGAGLKREWDQKTNQWKVTTDPTAAQRGLHESFLRLMQTHAPGGHVIIPGLTQKEVTKLYKTASEMGQIELKVRRRIKGEDSFDALVVDRERSILKGELFKESGGLPEYDEMVDAIRMHFDEKQLIITTGPDAAPGGAFGVFKPREWTGQDAIGISTNTPKFNAGFGVSTLLHEITHLLSHQRLRGRGITPEVRSGQRWEEFFDVIPSQFKDVEIEFRKATEALLLHQHKTFLGISSPRRVNEKISRNLDYFWDPHELISRMSELMLLNPAEARAIAPRASKLVGRLIQQEAPYVRELMTREGKELLDIWTQQWRRVEGVGTTVWTRERFVLSPEMVKEWQDTGWFSGMRTLLKGQDVEFLGRVGKDQAKIRRLDTLREETVKLSQLERPLFTSIARRNEDILKNIDRMLDSRATKLPVGLDERIGEGAWGVRRALIDVKDYLVLNNQTVASWIKGLPHATQEQLLAKHGTLELIDRIPSMIPNSKPHLIVKDALEMTGHKGLLRLDNGIPEVLVVDRNTLTKSNVLESAAHVLGNANQDILFPQLDDWLKLKLREEGVLEPDVDHFFNIATQRFGERLRRIVDPEVAVIEQNVAAARTRPAKLTQEAADELDLIDAEDALTRAGLEHARLSDGRVEIRDAGSKSILANVLDEDEAAMFARELSSENVGPNLGDFPGGGGTGGGGGRPPRANQPLIPSDPPLRSRGRGAELADSLLFPRLFSALENVAKKFEHTGLGPAYTKVYLPAHNAMLKVMREMSVTKRDALGGLTYADKLQQISKTLLKVSKKRHPIVTGYIESLTKEEIEKAGGLMVRAMTQNEVRVAQGIEAVGLGNDIPRLMAVDRLVKSALKGKSALENTIERMKRIQLSPEAQALLAQFEAAPRFKNRAEIEQFLGLSDAERMVIKVIDDSNAAGKEKFSIYAVSRYASAPKLKKGFKTGREQFAFENKMTPAELQAAKFSEETLEAAFLDSGLDPKRHLSGYWPHLRSWVKEGFVLDRDLLPDDVAGWVSAKYRTGELNVYEQDPLLTVYRHIRGLQMARHFDPLMPDLNRSIKALGSRQAHDVMQEYVLELRGKPHDSFDTMQRALSHFFKTVTGKDAPERLAQDVVNSLGAVTSSAFIPYRVGLIARNFFESVLKVSPRTGMSHYLKGLRYVTSSETRKEAFEMAMKAGAIRPGTTKLRSHHSAEEFFGPSAPHAMDRYLRLFDKGFEWYQSADDWGRAIAYHAQRIRVQDHLDDFVQGRISMAEFRSRSKIDTFDPLDAQIAEREILNGNYQKAIDHLGQVLSRETMTRYGYADHPAGWHSVPGRLFGQFGTWPVQYKDYLIQGVTRGSTKDKVEFAMTHAAVTGGIVSAGAAVGINLQNWTGSLMYTGGPYADLMIDVVRSVNGSDAEKAIARNNLYNQIPVLGWMETGNPRSLFLPGSYLLGDLADAKAAMESDDIFEAVMSGLSIKTMRPQDKNPLDLFDMF